MQDRAVDPVVTHLVAGYVWLVRTGVGRAQDFSGMLQVSTWIQSSGSLSPLCIEMAEARISRLPRSKGSSLQAGTYPTGRDRRHHYVSAPATEANLS